MKPSTVILHFVCTFRYVELVDMVIISCRAELYDYRRICDLSLSSEFK